MRLVIIGGVAAGASAAAKARRCNEEADIILYEMGEEISYATCGLPYYLSGIISKRDELLITTARIFLVSIRKPITDPNDQASIV